MSALRLRSWFLCSLIPFLPLAGSTSEGGLSFRERAKGLAAVERVLQTKRAVSAQGTSIDELPADLFERRADDILRKTQVLARRYGIAITPEMMKTELERVLRDSRDRATLSLMFAALDNDSRKIQEIIIRPLVTDGQLRVAYAFDPQLHVAAHHEANQYAQLLKGGAIDAIPSRNRNVRSLDPEDEHDSAILARGRESDGQRTDVVVDEGLETFVAHRVTRTESGFVLQSATVPKTPFDE